MVSMQSVERQLKRLKFNVYAWGKAEVKELPHILLPDEVIEECVNGIYEGGFALLVATDMRLLLIDKKPLNYLTVEDLRFEMINELDYSHRLVGAQISISAGSKNLKFKSYNQPRLRKLITHVQHGMANSKKQESQSAMHQKQHLEQINQQLQAYLIAQHQQQQSLRDQLLGRRDKSEVTVEDLPEPPKPSPELSDFLFAQSLLKQYREEEAKAQSPVATTPAEAEPVALLPEGEASQTTAQASPASPYMSELYQEGMQEIYGRKQSAEPQPAPATPASATTPTHSPLEINPLSIAYSKLPMALRNRKFGRPSFHAHSQQTTLPNSGQQASPAAS